MRRFLFIALIGLIMLTACGAGQVFSPTTASKATIKDTPTDTPNVTVTNILTPTPTILPVDPNMACNLYTLPKLSGRQIGSPYYFGDRTSIMAMTCLDKDSWHTNMPEAGGKTNPDVSWVSRLPGNPWSVAQIPLRFPRGLNSQAPVYI